MFNLLSKERLIHFIQSFGGMAVALLFQITTFILLTRSLGVGAYGIFVSAAAIGITISELISLGAGENFIRVAARDETRRRAVFVNGLELLAKTAIFIAIPLAPLAAYFIAPEETFWAVTAMIASEAILSRLGLYGEHVYLGLKDFMGAAFARVFIPMARCLSFMVVIFGFGYSDLESLIYTQIIATGFGATVMIALLARRILTGSARAANREERRNWAAFGIPVALANLQRGFQFQADKYLVTLIAGPEVGGVYAAGFRLVQMALLPLQAFMRTTYSSFFNVGRKGLEHSYQFAKSVIVPMVVLGFACTAAAFIGSYFVVYLIGEDFSEAAALIRMMSPVLGIWAFQYVLTDSLMGADRVWLRIYLSIIANLVSIGLFVMLVGQFGLIGAVGAVIGSTAFFVLLLFSTIQYLRATGRAGAHTSSALDR